MVRVCFCCHVALLYAHIQLTSKTTTDTTTHQSIEPEGAQLHDRQICRYKRGIENQRYSGNSRIFTSGQEHSGLHKSDEPTFTVQVPGYMHKVLKDISYSAPSVLVNVHFVNRRQGCNGIGLVQFFLSFSMSFFSVFLTFPYFSFPKCMNFFQICVLFI